MNSLMTMQVTVSTFSKLTIQRQERCELHYYAAVLIAFHKVRVISLFFFFQLFKYLGITGPWDFVEK